MKKYFILLFVASVVSPIMVSAAWWNPLSWFDGWSFIFSDNKIQTEEWNTYYNDKYDFSFEYPKTWEINDNNFRIILNKNATQPSFFSTSGTYIIIYPTGKPGSGAPAFKYENSAEFNNLIREYFITYTKDGEFAGSKVVKNNDGEVILSNISNFRNVPETNKNTDIFVGINVENLEYKCISHNTEEELSSDHCYSGDVPEGFDQGFNKIFGQITKEDKDEVYKILSTFDFTLNN